MLLSESRQQIWNECQGVQICAVTKGRSLAEISSLLNDLPGLSIIGENRWPDCEQTFQNFPKLERHFIGPLQSNKLNKVLPLISCLQSLDSQKLYDKIKDSDLEFLIQVNISNDEAKSGIEPNGLHLLIDYILRHPGQAKLNGIMTIGSQAAIKERQRYFAALRKLFDQVNSEYFSTNPLPTLSMGMSEDYQLAIKEGSTMVRLGSCLFD